MTPELSAPTTSRLVHDNTLAIRSGALAQL